VLKTLSIGFIFALAVLTSIFLIFTLFELWRFITVSGAGASLITRYLLFLLPFTILQLAPASMLLAVLWTYALMSRRSETIAWWAGGQSTYRLTLPCLLFALLIAPGVWAMQEHLMPEANVRQDSLRSQIRGGFPRSTTKGGRSWLASPDTGRLYAYEYEEESGRLIAPAIYEFDPEGIHLERIVTGRSGQWTAVQGQLRIEEAATIEIAAKLERSTAGETILDRVESAEAFKPAVDKPSKLSAQRLSDYIKQIKRQGGAVSALSVALQRKYAEPFSVIVMALVGAPVAFLFGRRHTLAVLSSAVAIGIIFWAVAGGFQQVGEYGLLPPAVAAWSPLVIFAALGGYLLSRART
jgi:LPS export ABC transporter permease LptG